MDYFESTRTTSWPVIILTPLIWVGIILFNFNKLLAPAGVINRITSGFIQPTLIFSVILFLIVICLVIILIGKIRFQDIGILSAKIPEAVGVIVGIWILLQVILIFTSLITGHGLSLDHSWFNPGFNLLIGSLIAQLFGNAMAEEIMFRGFLLPQLYLKLTFFRKLGKKSHLILSIFISQLCFALIHVPNLARLSIPGGNPFLKLVVLFIMGIFFSLIFLRTKNIFISVGLHALINSPTASFSSPVMAEILVFILCIGVVILWPKIQGIINKVFRKGSIYNYPGE